MGLWRFEAHWVFLAACSLLPADKQARSSASDTGHPQQSQITAFCTWMDVQRVWSQWQYQNQTKKMEVKGKEMEPFLTL